MVTATTMTASFQGIGALKRPYSVSGYISDVVGAKVLWNANGVAGTTSDTYVQFSEPVVLTDVSIITGPTVATGFRMQSGGVDVPQSATLLATNLTSVIGRNAPKVQFAAQSQIGAIQF
jgi:hypothetical protein